MQKLDSVLLVALVGMTALVGWQHSHPTSTTVPDSERWMPFSADCWVISNAVVRYANEANGGIMPGFDSARLPKWWPEYSLYSNLRRDIRYVIPIRFTGRPVHLYLSEKGPVILMRGSTPVGEIHGVR